MFCNKNKSCDFLSTGKNKSARRVGKGSLLLEAVIMMGLVALLTPILYIHLAEKKEATNNMAKANVMLQIQKAADNYLKEHSEDENFIGRFKNGTLVYRPSQLLYKNGDGSEDAYVSSNLDNSYRIGFKLNDDNSIDALIVETVSAGSDAKAVKIAGLIGVSAGVRSEVYSEGKGDYVYGINGLWRAKLSDYGLAGVPFSTTVLTTRYSKEKKPFYTSELVVDSDIDTGDYKFKATNITAQDTLKTDMVRAGNAPASGWDSEDDKGWKDAYAVLGKCFSNKDCDSAKDSEGNPARNCDVDGNCVSSCSSGKGLGSSVSQGIYCCYGYPAMNGVCVSGCGNYSYDEERNCYTSCNAKNADRECASGYHCKMSGLVGSCIADRCDFFGPRCSESIQTMCENGEWKKDDTSGWNSEVLNDDAGNYTKYTKACTNYGCDDEGETCCETAKKEKPVYNCSLDGKLTIDKGCHEPEDVEGSPCRYGFIRTDGGDIKDCFKKSGITFSSDSHEVRCVEPDEFEEAGVYVTNEGWLNYLGSNKPTSIRLHRGDNDRPVAGSAVDLPLNSDSTTCKNKIKNYCVVQKKECTEEEYADEDNRSEACAACIDIYLQDVADDDCVKVWGGQRVSLRHQKFTINEEVEKWTVVGPYVTWWEAAEICASKGWRMPTAEEVYGTHISWPGTNRDRRYILKVLFFGNPDGARDVWVTADTGTGARDHRLGRLVSPDQGKAIYLNLQNAGLGTANRGGVYKASYALCRRN